MNYYVYVALMTMLVAIIFALLLKSILWWLI